MQRVRHSQNGHPGDSVLIVNDMPEQLSLMHSLLRKAGFSVFTAEDGREAFEVAKQERPDVVISDVSMPRLNGIEFCKLIRQDSELNSTPILLVTAHRKDTDSVVEGLRSGADDYLELPFDSTRLIAKVARLLERSRLEASYRDLVEQASDLIFTRDMNGRITSINSAGANFIGAKPDELIGRSFDELFGVNMYGSEKISDLQIDELASESYQFLSHDGTGRERWLEIVTSKITDRFGEITGFRAVARDITDRKKIELELRESEERYRLLFESTPQPIWVYDEETLAFLAVNEAAVSTYGYSNEEFLSMTVDDLRSPEDSPALLIKTNGSSEPLISSPWRHQRKDGTNIYVEFSSHSLVFKGRSARLVIASDVTERKLLDEKQQMMHASLQHSAMEWRQTFNAIEFPVLIVDLEARVRRLNQAAEDIAGISSEEIIGRDIAHIGVSEPWATAAELVRTIKGNGTSSSTEVLDKITGKTWSITLYLINEFGSAGERAILIAQDITKRTQLETSLRQSEIMSLLGSLVAGVAHEVRNPLFGISSILDAFETRFSDRNDYLRYTDVLRDEVGRLTVLMEELLEYGKPFKGEFYPASIGEVVAKCIRACMPAAEVANVNLVNSINGNLPNVSVDRRRLSKVFVNLIENAIQHSNSGGQVSVEAHEFFDDEQGWIDCAVRDTGTGIADEDLPLIFEPFFSKRRGGTGLGLAIAHRIMSEHGGQLIAGNNPQGGACMTARFPLVAKQEVSNG